MSANSSSATDTLQRLVYGLSHDMGAPLRAVVQFSQLLQNSLSDRLTDKERYWFSLLQQGGSQAQQMLDALLVYSRLGSPLPPVTEFSLTELVNNCVQQQQHWYQQQQPAYSATIKVEVIPQIHGRRPHWKLLLEQLLNNALRFHPQQQAPEITVYCHSHDQQLTLEVLDNGRGMSNEQWQELIYPFRRETYSADSTTLGMGLSYCQRIAELNEGQLLSKPTSSGGLRVIYTQKI